MIYWDYNPTKGDGVFHLPFYSQRWWVFMNEEENIKQRENLQDTIVDQLLATNPILTTR